MFKYKDDTNILWRIFCVKKYFIFQTFNYYLRAQNTINIQEKDIIFKIEYITNPFYLIKLIKNI